MREKAKPRKTLVESMDELCRAFRELGREMKREAQRLGAYPIAKLRGHDLADAPKGEGE